MVTSTRKSLDIALVLLGVMVVELALNRLAVPALRPTTQNPGEWHKNLDHVALFVFHFATALSLAVAIKLLWDAASAADTHPRPLRAALAVFGSAFSVLALWSVVSSPSLTLQFALQTAFTLTVCTVVLARMLRPGHPAIKLGIIVLLAPLVLQYYAPFVLRVFDDADLSLYPNIPHYDLPATMRHWGQHAVVIGALVSPYLFAPRPVRISFARPAPLVIATFVGMIGGIIVREQYEVGAELAMMGLGFNIGEAGAPRSLIALYLLALASVTWTLVSCLIADSASRRRIGVGLALVVVGGYAFEWPLQYLVATVGLLVIGDASLHVDDEEDSAAPHRPTFHSPPISAEIWQRYVRDLVDVLRDAGSADPTAASGVSFDKQLGVTETHIVATRGGVAFQIRVTRADDAIQAIDVHCGARPPDDREPAWTLHARADRVLALGSHPEPPQTTAPAHKTHDEPFDRRFRVRDRGGLTDELFDDGLRARATAMIDGWLAYWPGTCLYYRVFPGRGAPLDHPIPITELAFRGAGAPAPTDRLLGVLDVLGDIARRAGLDRISPEG